MINRILLLLIFCCHSSWLMAMPSGTPTYNIRHYTDENGLPQNSIKSIAPDKYGFLWFATENGLVRFDGRNFKVFSNLGSVNATKRYVAIIPHESGDLYAVNAASQLMRITQRAAQATATKYTHLLQFPTIGNKTIYIAYGIEHSPAIHEGWKGFLVPISNSKYYLITKDTVGLYDNKEQKYKVQLTEDVVYENFFTLNEKLYYLNEKGICKLVNKNNIQTASLRGISNRPFKVFKNYVSKQVFLYQGDNLYLVKASTTDTLVLKQIITGFDFDEQNISSVYYDAAQGHIFLGSRTNGLFVIDECKFHTITTDGKAKDEVYYGQVPFLSHKILTAKGDVIDTNAAFLKLPLILQYSDNYCIVKDLSNNIWTKKGHVVSCISSDAKSVIRQWKFDSEVNVLVPTSQNKIWVGTKQTGLFELSLQYDTTRLITDKLNNVNYIAFDKGLVWVASGAGLCRYYQGIGKVEVIKGTENKYIRSIYVSDVNVWFTAADEGVFLYRYGKLNHFPLDVKQYLSSAHCILEDSSGYFWITTNKGLFQVAKEELLSYAQRKQVDIFYMYYSKEAGFNTNEFNGGCQPCGLKMQNGIFSFPSLNGLVWFKPAEIHPDFPDSSIYIDKVDVDGIAIAYGDTLKLHSSFDRVNITLSILYFGNPYNLDVDYQIQERFNGKWIQLGSDNIISYTTLPTGSYHLIVRKKNGFGANNYTYRTLVIVVPAPFYKTWYFIVIAIVCLFAIVYAYLWWRLHYMNRKNDVLEERINARTSELNEMVHALQNSEEALQKQNYFQQKLITAITHDVKSPLKYLAITAKSMFDRSKQKSNDEDLQENADMIYSTSSSMLNFVSNLLDYIKGYQYNNSITERFYIYDVVAEKASLFSEIAALQNDNIINKVPVDTYITTNKQVLSVVIHNLLDNAVKYTRNGSVFIRERQTVDYYEIIVSDDGVGIAEEQLKRYSRNTLQQDEVPAKGLGLSIVIDLLKLISGEMDIQSKLGEGTIVTIRFSKDIIG